MVGTSSLKSAFLLKEKKQKTKKNVPILKNQQGSLILPHLPLSKLFPLRIECNPDIQTTLIMEGLAFNVEIVKLAKMRVFSESVSTLFATGCLMAVSKRSLIWKRSRHVKRLKGSNNE